MLLHVIDQEYSRLLCKRLLVQMRWHLTLHTPRRFAEIRTLSSRMCSFFPIAFKPNKALRSAYFDTVQALSVWAYIGMITTTVPKIIAKFFLIYFPKARSYCFVRLIDGAARIFPTSYAVTRNRAQASSVAPVLRAINPGRFTDLATAAAATYNCLVGLCNGVKVEWISELKFELSIQIIIEFEATWVLSRKNNRVRNDEITRFYFETHSWMWWHLMGEQQQQKRDNGIVLKNKFLARRGKIWVCLSAAITSRTAGLVQSYLKFVAILLNSRHLKLRTSITVSLVSAFLIDQRYFGCHWFRNCAHTSRTFASHFYQSSPTHGSILKVLAPKSTFF